MCVVLEFLERLEVYVGISFHPISFKIIINSLMMYVP